MGRRETRDNINPMKNLIVFIAFAFFPFNAFASSKSSGDGVWIILILLALLGWYFLSSNKKDSKNKLRNEIEQEYKAIKEGLIRREAEIGRQQESAAKELSRKQEIWEKHLEKCRNEFSHSYAGGRKWLANFIADGDRVVDEAIAGQMRNKKRPALSASEEVAAARMERREWKFRAKFLEYQLASYKEYFPFLEEYEEIILDEAIPLQANANNLGAIEQSDPALLYIPKAEYDALSTTDRNQHALDNYLSGHLGHAAIGRLYERYIGYLYERDGWDVEYQGILKGLEDMGRDLICTKGNRVEIVQAKCWGAGKTIHEKHIFQLFGTTLQYVMEHPQYVLSGNRKGAHCLFNYQDIDLFSNQVSAVFTTSTSLSDVARSAAECLGITIKEQFPLDKKYPMIKCNINQTTGEKIYHLPFDQQYDRTRIILSKGECYASTVSEAESKGFRRAFRFSGVGVSSSFQPNKRLM